MTMSCKSELPGVPLSTTHRHADGHHLRTSWGIFILFSYHQKLLHRYRRSLFTV